MLDADSAPAASAPARFTWVPMYREVAAKVLEYRDRPGELIDLLTDMVDLKVVSTRDQNPEGNWIPLGDIDPFTFFSSFNRKITLANRRAILERLKRTWNLSADVPTDFEGVPLVNNQSAWFFSYRFRRRDEDIPLLWEVAQAGYSGGPDSLSESLWNRCHRIRQIATPKLTMGLFWLNPTQYLPLDRGTRKYAAARGISVPPFPTLEQYRAFLGEVRTEIDNDLVSVSAATYAGLPDEAGLEPRYWVGGHHWSDGSKLDAFREKEAWWHGWSRDGDADAAKVWKVFDQIAVGDYFAIKGYGGKNDLRVHFVGTVSEKDDDSGRVELAPMPLPDPRKIRPARGTGSWFGTLREVTDPAIIAWMFHGEPYTPTETEEEENGGTVPPGPLNTILYGPPGTGKTFATIRRAVEIADPEFRATSDDAREAHRERKARFDELRADGRIEFVTFHQSFGYDEFVEGIRPVMDGGAGDGSPRYAVQDGVLKQIALRALAATLEPAEEEGATPSELDFERLWETFLDRIEEEPLLSGATDRTKLQLIVTSDGSIRATNLLSDSSYVYRTTPSIVRQVFIALRDRPDFTGPMVNEVLGRGSDRVLIGPIVRELREIERSGRALNARKPRARPGHTPDQQRRIAADYLQMGEASGYRLKPAAAWPRFVLVVDEINRGNVSRILGELITLVEDDKRVGSGENDLTVTLPHSRETFGLPANLYLLGTMNTADKSIALVDVALRRRFAFEELTPDFGPAVCPGLTDAMRAALTTLNRRIALRLDRDHRIGHAYFVRVSDEAGFDEVFARRIVPLLQEYFYNDWDGLRYVLGESGGSGSGRFVVRQGGDDREVRTRWRWRTDDGDGDDATDAAEAALSPLAALRANYG